MPMYLCTYILAQSTVSLESKNKKFTLFSNYNTSLRQQPGAMTIGHSPKGKENPLNLSWILPVLSAFVCLLPF